MVEEKYGSVKFHRSKKKNQYNESAGLYRDEGDSIYENILIITTSNPFGYQHICMTSYMEVKPNITIRILREHAIDNYTLQYFPSMHGINGKLSSLIQPEQLKNIFQQIHDFLIYDAKKHKDIETLNQWLNHGDEKEYITGLGTISRLVLAK